MTPRPAGRGQWELAGLPQEFLEIFSKRSHQIEEMVGRDASSSQKEIAALRTRNAKESVPMGEELEQRWRTELASTGIAPWMAALQPSRGQDIELDQIREHQREISDPPEIAGRGPVAVAASALFRHDSVIDRRRLLEGGFVEAALQKLGPDDVYAELLDLEAKGALLRLSDDCWTTPAVAACEAAMMRAANRPQEREWFKANALIAAIEKAPHLTAEQLDAVRQAARADGVSIIEAGAGTGKTTLAKALVDAARGSGLNVVGLAPSWVAADELSRTTQIEAVAIARWRYDNESGHGRKLDASTVIIVDEAGMTGTRDMSAILTAAHERGAKVVLVGDRRQLSSVSGASALKGVSEVVRQGAVLDGVRRQKIDWQRAASVLMARGDAEAGLRAYAARNRMELVAGQATAQEQVISHWKEQRERYGDDVLILTRRNSDCASLNQIARETLKTEGVIRGQEFEAPALDREDKPVTLSLACGDRVRFGESLTHLGIRNGNRGVVEEIRRGRDGDMRVAFKLEDGRRVEDDWRNFARERQGKKIHPPKIVHAYAGTVYAAQGRTAAASVMYIASPTDAREVYVVLTRHSHDAHIVVERDRLDALCRQRQTDHRINPSETAMRERLFDEARQYREKANVVDFCADRAAFIRTAKVDLAHPEIGKWTVQRAILTVQGLRNALAWLEPSRLFVSARLMMRRRGILTPELPKKLAAIVNKVQKESERSKNERSHSQTYDR